ncbi:uncharacterized protein TRAVEDRAFT_29075 [Trametes versicolor FP-101664 SS1]|uniref:uncharacterized protein n=1 Tax=Trametes versicolor (strain FP-101664) TaxID=717944 RepID=UPI000462255D|nr:uncharacterized protein TRAVEDRAFT_29075 [Trametes versicolor FP-101664 SS1]EIW58489.1 hypothetical protein TRAVEDRAFT_29075 [Trametes versicolor FP-101664 SS1]
MGADTGNDATPANSTRKQLREAGRFENYFFARARLGFLSWVVVSAKYHNGAGAALDKPTLFVALDHVVRCLPALASRMEYTASLPTAPAVWLRLPSVDLNKLVEFREEDSTQLHTVLETMYAAPAQYADDVPPWKLFVLRDGTVAFTYEHTIGDGQSGMAFHAALLNALCTPIAPPTEHSGVVTDLPEDASLSLAMEDAMDVSVPITMLLWEIFKPFWPPAQRRLRESWTGKDVPSDAIRGMTVRILGHYPPADGKYLVELSRAHKTTLTGTLHTVALVVLSRLIRTHPEAEKYKTIATTVPISMRRFTHVPPTAFCNHVSALREDYPILPLGSKEEGAIMTAENFPWDLAAGLVDALKREAPRSGSAVGLLKFVGGKYEQYLRSQLGKKRAAGLELSNIGPFPVAHLEKTAEDAPPSSRWDADEVLFAQASATLGPALCLNVAGTPAGGFGVTVTYNREAVDEALAEEFVEAFKAGVQGLLASRPAS